MLGFPGVLGTLPFPSTYRSELNQGTTLDIALMQYWIKEGYYAPAFGMFVNEFYLNALRKQIPKCETADEVFYVDYLMQIGYRYTGVIGGYMPGRSFSGLEVTIHILRNIDLFTEGLTESDFRGLVQIMSGLRSLNENETGRDTEIDECLRTSLEMLQKDFASRLNDNVIDQAN